MVFFIGFSALISIIFITASLLGAAILYPLALHLKAFNNWARRQALTKSED